MSLRAVVDKVTNMVKGFYEDIPFPINGNYVVELPDNFDTNTLANSLITTLTTAKKNAYLAQHPIYTTATSSELLLASEFSIPIVFGSDYGSQYLILGDNKGTHFPATSIIPILDSPVIGTVGPITIPASSTFFIHLDAFVLTPVIDTSTSTPTFTKYFYNYDPYTNTPITLDLGTLFTTTIRYPPGLTANITLDQEFTVAAITDVAIQITLNTIPALPSGAEIHISSYVMLHRP
jgi:hypothetical protein